MFSVLCTITVKPTPSKVKIKDANRADAIHLELFESSIRGLHRSVSRISLWKHVKDMIGDLVLNSTVESTTIKVKFKNKLLTEKMIFILNNLDHTTLHGDGRVPCCPLTRSAWKTLDEVGIHGPHQRCHPACPEFLFNMRQVVAFPICHMERKLDQKSTSNVGRMVASTSTYFAFKSVLYKSKVKTSGRSLGDAISGFGSINVN